jgi:hypothetical protein
MTEKITTTAQLLKNIEFLLWLGPLNDYGAPVYQDIYDEIETAILARCNEQSK